MGNDFDRDRGAKSSMTIDALSYLHSHGIYDGDLPHDYRNRFLGMPFLQALSLVCFFSAKPGFFNLRESYLNSVRALNTLALLIEELRPQIWMDSFFIARIVDDVRIRQGCMVAPDDPGTRADRTNQTIPISQIRSSNEMRIRWLGPRK